MKTLKSYHKEHIDKMKKIKRISFGIFSILLILFVFIFVKMYNSIITPNISTKGNYSLYIYSNDDFETIKNKLYSDSIIINRKSFEWVAKKLDYPKYIKSGHYVIKDGMSNRHLLNMLIYDRRNVLWQKQVFLSMRHLSRSWGIKILNSRII